MIRTLGRTRVAGLALAGALLATGCIGSLDIAVNKRVTGGSSSGPFTVHISCKVQNVTEPIERDITFNGQGTKSETFTVLFPTTCKVTEPESAGAVTVTFTCDSIQPDNKGVTCTKTANGLEIVSPSTLSDDVTVTVSVTNDFTPPPTPTPPQPAPEAAPAPAAEAPAPAPVVAAATFTG
jgi:uncharacterized protein DUF5979